MVVPSSTELRLFIVMELSGQKSNFLYLISFVKERVLLYCESIHCKVMRSKSKMLTYIDGISNSFGISESIISSSSLSVFMNIHKHFELEN
jgi:hypothetical protein